jgi:hypothetical protein
MPPLAARSFSCRLRLPDGLPSRRDSLAPVERRRPGGGRDPPPARACDERPRPPVRCWPARTSPPSSIGAGRPGWWRPRARMGRTRPGSALRLPPPRAADRRLLEGLDRRLRLGGSDRSPVPRPPAHQRVRAGVRETIAMAVSGHRTRSCLTGTTSSARRTCGRLAHEHLRRELAVESIVVPLTGRTRVADGSR